MTDLQKGLVGHWTMDDADTSGGTLYDSSAYDNHGTINGGVTTSVSGKIGDAFDFDGSEGTGIRMGLSSPPPTTLCGWVNLDSTSAEAVVVNNPEFVGQNLYVQSGDAIAEVILDNNDNSIQARSSVSTGNWYHLVAVLDSNSGQVELYVNGQEKSSQSWDGTYDGDSNINNIGTDELNAPEQPLDGEIDDVRVYNRALSANEVRALYNMRSQRQQTSNLEKGLVGHWTMDDSDTSGGSIYNSTPYDTDPSISGTVTSGDSAIVNTGTTFSGGYASTTDYQDLPTGSDTFTVTTFFKLDTLPSNSTGARADIWSWGEASKSNYNAVDLYDDNISWYNYSNDPNNDIYINWNLGEWYFYYTKWDGSTSYTGLFDLSGVIDELQDGLTGVNVSENGGFSIARDFGRDTSYFEGTIDDLRVYNRVLTKSEILRLYNKR